MITDQVAADSTSSLLLSMQPGIVHFHNTGPNTVFIGESGVTVSDGFPLLITESIDIDTRHEVAVIHAVCAAVETATVAYIIV